MSINKAKLTETDIISKYIMPAIKNAGWDDMSQIRQEVKLRDGKVIVRGQLGVRKTVKSADIVLYHKPSMPLAVIEAKANKHEVGKEMDSFDMICHVVYDQPALTGKDRSNNVQRRNYFTKYSDTAQAVLQNLLVKYADVGVQDIVNMKVLKVALFTDYGNLSEIVKKGFGGKQEYQQAILELQQELYKVSG
jgi:type I site-specific restriction endonuclease